MLYLQSSDNLGLDSNVDVNSLLTGQVSPLNSKHTIEEYCTRLKNFDNEPEIWQKVTRLI